MKDSTRVVEQIVNVKGKRTFANTIKVLADFESEFGRKSTQLGFYSEVSTSKEIREASKEHQKAIGDFSSELWIREDLQKVIKDYKIAADKDGSFKKLDKESQRYVEKTLEDFESSGMNLPKEKKLKML